MALPSFFSRIADAAAPLLGGLRNDALAERLEAAKPVLRCRDAAGDDAALREGFLFATNLAARLYPRLALDAEDDLAAEARGLALAINPQVEFDATGDLVLAISPDAPEGRGVSVFARGWNLVVDGGGAGESVPAAPAAALAGAAFGIGEIFRTVFADLVPRGRTGSQPRSFDLVSLAPWGDAPVRDRTEVGSAHLAGGGAIGEAAALTLRAAGAAGELTVVDHECLEEPNLQRYVLATLGDVGERKTAILARALAGSSLDVVQVPTRWGVNERSGPGRETVLVALDSGPDRIGVQAGLHRRVYNAYTGEHDLGWSRHERFGGDDACLACLYWPSAPRPNGYEIAASALRQHPLRVRIYFANGILARDPMPPPGDLAVELPATEELERWQATPIIDDIAEALGIERPELDPWAAKPLDALYRDVICGGAIVRVNAGLHTRDVLVPLAHQSALAGVMLATQLLVVSDDELRSRRAELNAGRIDILTEALDSVAIPEFPVEACICRDDVYRAAWTTRWAS